MTVRIYRTFGVKESAGALLHPKAWGDLTLGVLTTKPGASAEGGKNGLPADFLIAPDGIMVAAHYGTHASDHRSVDGVVAVAARAKPNESRDDTETSVPPLGLAKTT